MGFGGLGFREVPSSSPAREGSTVWGPSGLRGNHFVALGLSGCLGFRALGVEFQGVGVSGCLGFRAFRFLGVEFLVLIRIIGFLVGVGGLWPQLNPQASSPKSPPDPEPKALTRTKTNKNITRTRTRTTHTHHAHAHAPRARKARTHHAHAPRTRTRDRSLGTVPWT